MECQNEFTSVEVTVRVEVTGYNDVQIQKPLDITDYAHKMRNKYCFFLVFRTNGQHIEKKRKN